MPTRTNPRLQKRPNGIYYIIWSEGRRSQRASTRTTDLAAAKKCLSAWLMLEVSADTKETSDAQATVAEVWSLYFEDAQRRRADAGRLEHAWRHLAPAFGHLTPTEVKQAHIDKYVRDRSLGRAGRKASQGTIWLELMKLRAALNYGVKRKVLRPNERPSFEGLQPPEARDRWLRPNEFADLLAQAERDRGDGRLSRVERFLHIAIQTGARRRVIETLTWDRVDFEIGVIHYRAAGTMRGVKKRPSVPISKALRPILERAYTERCSNFVLDTDCRIDTPLANCAAKAKVPEVSAHVLRHTAATWMARRGVPLWQIAGVLGNSALIVEKVYAKHAPDGLVAAVEAIGAPV